VTSQDERFALSIAGAGVPLENPADTCTAFMNMPNLLLTGLNNHVLNLPQLQGILAEHFNVNLL